MAKPFDIIVVGGGIAGLSAGITAARLGRRTIVVTGDTLGGHLITIDRIDGYPGFPDGIPGYDLCPIAQEQAMTAGAEFSMGNMTSLARDGDGWTVNTATGSFVAPAVILATGTKLRDLGIPGESELRGKGVSHCASCDAPLLRGQPAVVAGGGDSALQEALTLAEHGSDVSIVHRGPELTAQTAYRQLVEAQAKISTHADSEVVEILGDDAVTGARVRTDGGTTDIECAGVFVFIGLQPNSAYLDDDTLVDATGRIVTDARLRTKRDGLLAAGTVRSQSAGRAAAAAGEGALAAMSADRFLSENEW